jgi:hypothetical protein
MIQTYREELLRIIPILDPKFAASIEVHVFKPEAFRFLLQFRSLMELNVTFDVADEEVFGCNGQIGVNSFPVTMELLVVQTVSVKFLFIYLVRFARSSNRCRCKSCVDVP